MKESLDVDCWHHLRNAWILALCKKVGKHLTKDLKEELNEIDSRLRVKLSMDRIMFSLNKLFCLTSNYPKGEGDAFKACMEECHPDNILYHVPNTKGNRQDIICTCAGPACMNRPLCIEYLDKRFRAHEKDNILEENMYILLSSLSTTAMFRLFSIIDLSIVMPMRWFAGNSHLLSEHGWSVRSNGRLLDTLCNKMTLLGESPSHIINEEFMMGLFNEHKNEIPPFNEHINYLYNDKVQYKVVRGRVKYQPLKLLREELFHPIDPSNIETDFLMEDMGSITSETLLQEFTDEKKATSNHLSEIGGKYSWELTTDSEELAGVGLHANNNASESAFGGLTEALTRSSMISLSNAGAMSQTRRNGDFSRTLLHAKKKKVDQGMSLIIIMLLKY